MSNFKYPLLFEPIIVPKVWGGGLLADIPGRNATSDSANPMGESWDVSTWPTAPDNKELVTVTKITNGPLAGKRLAEVTDIPVVVKLIDSGDKLSVQNHPVLPDVHKNEMWYIVDCTPDGYLYFDLAQGVTPEQVCDVLKSDNPSEDQVLGMLQRYDMTPGRHLTVPTGVIHALGPGLLTFEISEKTQVTYRLYDYNRERSRGKLDTVDGCTAVMTPRPDTSALDPGIEISGATEIETITEFPTFDVLRVAGEKIKVSSAKHMHLVSAVKGNCKITGPTSEWNIDLGYSFTCLVPRTESPYTIEIGGGEVLISPLLD